MGLRGHVLDTNFGARYGVTRPLALTRIRKDVSPGKCVAAMILPPRLQTSCSSQVSSASASIANLLNPWILEHPCNSWLWDVPKIEALAAQPRTAWALADYCILVVGTEIAHCLWLETWTAEICTGLLAHVLEPVDIVVCLDTNCSSTVWLITLRILFFT